MFDRSKELKELEPGLNAIFGLEYDRYEAEDKVLFEGENSNRAWEEEVLFTGFGAAPTKAEGQAVSYDDATESYVARYNHETIALAFAITEEAMEDNLYTSISKRLSKALARAMAHTKQLKAANVYNNAFSSSYVGGDNVALLSTAHPLVNNNTVANKPSTDVDLSETALEDAAIAIAKFVDDRNVPIAVQPRSLHIPPDLVFVANRLLDTVGRVGTSDNDLNAINHMSVFPGGAHVNHRFTDTDAWFIRTDCPDSMKHFTRAALYTKMEGDFETGNVRFKARERYVYGWSDWRGVYGSQGG